jgi:methionyl-tRNA formyltransferase
MDAGPILVQRPLNLRGELSDILKRIETVGYEATIDILEDNYELTHQNNDQATYCKRRRPSQSEITLDELQTSSALEIYNKVRCLQDPYPNAFLRLPDGSVLYLKSVSCDV